MNSHQQPYGRWFKSQPKSPQFLQKSLIREDTLKVEEIQIERKNFRFTLKENTRGRLLRISEEMGARRNTIIIPATGLRDFLKLLDEMILATEALSQGKKSSEEQAARNNASPATSGKDLE